MKLAITVSNYVKFRRGTPDAFKSLRHKDADTLYFIYEEDELTGELYLGSKLIAGSGEINGANALKDLSDVVLQNLDAEDFLVYDITQSKWVNKPIKDVLENFVGANENSNGISGLVPAPKAGQTGLFLRSDGTWSEIVSTGSGQVFNGVVEEGESFADAITRIVTTTPQKGDIVALRQLIRGIEKYTYTSLSYNGSSWITLSGNYTPDDIYFEDNLIITADIGVQKVDETGRKELPTAGKSLKEVLKMILAERALPTKVEPSISIEWMHDVEYEVGTKVSPSYKITFDPGSYSFGPETGVSLFSQEVVFNGEVINELEGTFKEVIVDDLFNKKIMASIVHSAGVAPYDNLGEKVNDTNYQIQKGNKTGESNTIKGYRKMFFGANSEVKEVISDNIRALGSCKEDILPIEVNIEKGTKQIIIAVPVGYEVKKIEDNNAFGMNMISKFTKSIVSIDGASAGYKKDYNVYEYKPAVALNKNVYTVKF